MPPKPKRRYDHPAQLGLDPGKNGGIALLNDGAVTLWRMPSTDRELFSVLKDIADSHDVFAVVEKLHAMPKSKRGVISAFKLGMSFGKILMALEGARLQYDLVTARAWQKALSIPPREKGSSDGEWKNSLKKKAIELYPKMESSITLANCDALLIATYCKRRIEGEL